MDDDATRADWALLALGSLAYAWLLFVWFTLPAYLAPISAQLGLSDTQAGLLAGAVPLTYVPLSLVSGLAVDRIGPGRAIAAGVAVFGTAQLARAGADGFLPLLLFTLGIGVGGTAVTFGLPKLVSEVFPPRRLGTASTVYLLGSYAGTTAAFALGRGVLGPALGGWRPLFLASGAGALAFCLVWIGALRAVDLPRPDGDADFSRASVGRDLRAVLGHRELWLVVALGVTYLTLTHGLQGWLTAVLESRGVAAGVAAGTTSLLVVAQAAGAVAVPPLSDRLDARRGAVVTCGLACTLGVAALLAGTGTAALAGVVVAGAGVGGLAPLVRAIPAELDGVGPELTGVAVGLVFAVGEVGGFLGPVVVGSLRDATGSFGPGLAVLAGVGLLGTGAGLAMRSV